MTIARVSTRCPDCGEVLEAPTAGGVVQVTPELVYAHPDCNTVRVLDSLKDAVRILQPLWDDVWLHNR